MLPQAGEGTRSATMRCANHSPRAPTQSPPSAPALARSAGGGEWPALLPAALLEGAAVAQGKRELFAALQGVQTAAPVALQVPSAHGRHVVADVAPSAGEKVPALQGAQAAAPSAPLQEPAAQGRQAAAEVAPTAGENVPLLQRAQAAAAGSALQEPAAQGTQAEAAVAPGAGEIIPAPQGVQFDAPAALHEPTVQIAHCESAPQGCAKAPAGHHVAPAW